VRAATVRVEHAEMVDDGHVAALARLGVVASVQPGFDAAWGGTDGMYAHRLGVERAVPMNPFGRMSGAGVVLAFGSDAPVTPVDPWGGVRAAAFHRTAGSRMTVRAGFAAHTRGGWRALGRAGAESGVLAPGEVASYAVWRVGELVVTTPDARVAAWSTDERAGVPGLPDLTPGRPSPECVRTVVAGRVVHDSGELHG
jgi:predicted amidohydrolase YtcJ